MMQLAIIQARANDIFISALSDFPEKDGMPLRKLVDLMLLVPLMAAIGYLLYTSQRDGTLFLSTAASATPTMVPTSTPSPTPSATATPTRTATALPTRTFTPSPLPSATPSPSISPVPSSIGTAAESETPTTLPSPSATVIAHQELLPNI